jgi:hypothetical protein
VSGTKFWPRTAAIFLAKLRKLWQPQARCNLPTKSAAVSSNVSPTSAPKPSEFTDRQVPAWNAQAKPNPEEQRPASLKHTPIPADYVYTVEESKEALGFLSRLKPELQAYAVTRMAPNLLTAVTELILAASPALDEFPAAVRVLKHRFGATSTASVCLAFTPKVSFTPAPESGPMTVAEFAYDLQAAAEASRIAREAIAKAARQLEGF